MWNSFIYKDDAYIINVVHTISVNSTKYKIILSDVIHVWIEELTSEQIIERCKTLNPLIDTTEETFITIVLSLLKDINSESVLTLSKIDDIVNLECVTNSEGATVKFNLNLKLADASTCCKEFTVPMMQTIQSMENQQKILCDLLEKKDIEIQQHVFENGELKRSDVVTEKFDKTALGSSDKLCYNVFSKCDEFQKIIIEKYGCLDSALLKVKKEEKTSKKTKLSLAKSIIRHKKPKISTNVKLK